MAAPHDVSKVGHRIGLDQAFGQRRRLDQEEPVPVGAREGVGRAFVHRQRRRDVQQHHPRHRARVVQRQPVGNPRAAVVGADGEALEAQRAHQAECVERHRALAVGGVVGVGWHAFGVAITAQVGGDDREA